MSGQRSVDVRQEGIVEYKIAFELMKELQQLRIADKIPDTILIMEHPEIVTVGPRARNDGITAPPGYLTFPVDRGGGLTWHGSGQVVCYPIFKWNLADENSVTEIINKIEQWVIQALESLNIPARRDDRMQGVWVGDHKNMQYWTIVSEMDLETWFYYQPQHTSRKSGKSIWLWAR